LLAKNEQVNESPAARVWLQVGYRLQKLTTLLIAIISSILKQMWRTELPLGFTLVSYPCAVYIVYSCSKQTSQSILLQIRLCNNVNTLCLLC